MQANILILLIAITAGFSVNSIDGQERNCHHTHRIFESGSDLSEVLPSVNSPGTPTNVRIELWLDRYMSLCMKTSTFEFFAYVSEMWADPSLRFDPATQCDKADRIKATGKYLDKIWTPKMHFLESPKSEASPDKNFIVIYENGTLWRNYKTLITAPCKLNLAKFPMDDVTCTLTYTSFLYNENQISVNWSSDPIVQLRTDNFLPNYIIASISTNQQSQDYPLGAYTELQVEFKLRRLCGWHVRHLYIPSFMLVFISWIAFCLGQAITARAVIGLGSLALLIVQQNFVLTNAPQFSGINYMDLWMGVCFLFVFLSLLELALFAILARSFCTNYNLVNSQTDNETTRLLLSDSKNKFRKASKVPTIVDIIFAVLFPVCFLIFACVYFFEHVKY